MARKMKQLPAAEHQEELIRSGMMARLRRCYLRIFTRDPLQEAAGRRATHITRKMTFHRAAKTAPVGVFLPKEECALKEGDYTVAELFRGRSRVARGPPTPARSAGYAQQQAAPKLSEEEALRTDLNRCLGEMKELLQRAAKLKSVNSSEAERPASRPPRPSSAAAGPREPRATDHSAGAVPSCLRPSSGHHTAEGSREVEKKPPTPRKSTAAPRVHSQERPEGKVCRCPRPGSARRMPVRRHTLDLQPRGESPAPRPRPQMTQGQEAKQIQSPRAHLLSERDKLHKRLAEDYYANRDLGRLLREQGNSGSAHGLL
eukprot:TRINITY_DN3399_c0_g1_i1.p1 TRINITY_DN3399_c0_g1~~TRINITY_DN3399_c0_g1_i1.p1  ORF type:complete len:316 (+),score=54.37 TRINITY_DN3399_c0_g1_i1:55-1002(+)